MTKDDIHYGKSYAFLNSKAPRDILPLVIEDAREMYNVPNELELKIFDGPEKLYENRDERLNPHIKKALETRMGYALEAKCKGMTNEQTADELKSILNGIYLGSKEVDKNYSAFVLHKDNQGRYIVQEQDNFLQTRD